jgi:hypothetical protein
MNNSDIEKEFKDRIRSALNQGTSHLDSNIALRLYEARCDALRHQSQPAGSLGMAGIGQLVVSSLQGHFRGVLALLALLIGVAGGQVWYNTQQATELAEIDSALLGDEVPPSAYTDQGFMEWLQHVSESDDNSLPE